MTDPGARPGERLLAAVEVMDRLRSPGGCPWDAAQTHESLVPYAIEEAYEVADAVTRGEDLADELGDLLLQVLFHARIAAERTEADGGFTIDDVADALIAKMTRRHPHVFGDATVQDADEVRRNWETIKQAERDEVGQQDVGSALAGAFRRVPTGLPALSRLTKVAGKVTAAGLDVDAVAEAATGGLDAMDGALALAVVAAIRAGVDPEAAMRRFVGAFEKAALAAEAEPEGAER